MYRLSLSQAALNDINAALQYIRDVFKDPVAAENLISKIEKEFDLIKKLPFSRHLVIDAHLSSLGIRAALIKNYILFYFVDGKKKTVYIVRFLHSRRNWLNILSH